MVACALFAGITAGHALSPEYLPAVVALAALLAAPATAIAALSVRRQKSVNAVDAARRIGDIDGLAPGRRRWKTGGLRSVLAVDCMLLLSFALTGTALHSSIHSLVAPDDISLLPTQTEMHAETRVREVRYRDQGRPRAVVAVRQFGIGGIESRSASGLIWVTLPKGAPVLRRGDVALMVGTAEIPTGRRNPGAFDFSSYLHEKRIHRVMRPHSVELLTRPTGIEDLSSAIERTIRRHLCQEPAALLRGLLLGRTDRLSVDIVESFRASGTVHVLAVSGLHTGFILLIAFALLRTLRVPPRAARLATIPLLFAFVMAVGSRPSVVRAALMATVFIATWSIQRRPNPLNAVGLAAITLLLSRPGAAFDLGFRLSFAAVLGIIFMRQPILKIMKCALRCNTDRSCVRSCSGALEFLLGAFALSISAQMGVVPIIVSSGGDVSLVAPLANLIVVPLAGASVASGLAMLAIDPVAPEAAHVLAAATWATLRALIVVVRLVGEVPAASVTLPTSLATPLALTVIASAVSLRARRRKTVLCLRAVTAATVLIGLVTLLTGPGRTHTRVIFFDVGQGDCALIEVPFGRRVLVDAGPAALGWNGPDSGRDVIVPYLRSRGIRSLDALVITHAHADHYGGAAAVLSSVRVDRLVVTADFIKAERVPWLLEQADAAGTRVVTLAPGDSLRLGSDCALVCLAPSDLWASHTSNENDRSIVLSARLDGLNVLLTGDIEAPAERMLHASSLPIKTDILKVAHHGSSTSSTVDFLQASSAEIAVVSVGRNNRYGHPCPRTIARLGSTVQEVFRTDLDGAVVVDVGKKRTLVRSVGSGRNMYFYFSRRPYAGESDPEPARTIESRSGWRTRRAALSTCSEVMEPMMSGYLSS